ncbi:hypothetical protein OPV22_023682 [Ensete ventricosum]|uniref:Uncharacterized protein n=1 Tax=Ensete ventricosum TaxID=4639 RepID=A0AAV8QP49_ENSVE|nr:hypothetical protein OPV22_023682 [Ensete ventricosum]
MATRAAPAWPRLPTPRPLLTFYFPPFVLLSLSFCLLLPPSFKRLEKRSPSAAPRARLRFWLCPDPRFQRSGEDILGNSGAAAMLQLGTTTRPSQLSPR